MEILVFGAGKTVTGSCFGVHTEKTRIIVDCGMFQGGKEFEKKNYDDFGFNPKDYSALVLTHAHLDHCGRIPKMVKEGFEGYIYCTEATRDLAEIVLLDAAKIADYDVEKENVRLAKKGMSKRQPIYTELDVQDTMKLFRTVNYNESFKISNDIHCMLHEAGHIIGAASVRLEVLENGSPKSIAFSGDLGQETPVIVKEKREFDDTDFLLMESTYGDRTHSPVEERKQKLLNVIRESFKRGGVLMIPTFAIERAQELIYEIGDLYEKNLIPRQTVYVDSPMASKATDVFKKHHEFYNKELKDMSNAGEDPFDFPGLVFTDDVEDSKAILLDKYPHIIIAGSGMCTAGRIKHHIRNLISDPKNTILFIGYQAEGTLGNWIKNGQKRIRLLGVEVEVNAKVESIDGYSGHGDINDLINWVKNINPAPEKILLVHGEEPALKNLHDTIKTMGINVYVPSMFERVIL